jgi:lipoprotein-anchoring transpeptidase ErfK/SrfK
MIKKIVSYKTNQLVFILSICIALIGCVPADNTNSANTNTNINSASENTNADDDANMNANSDVSLYTDEEENVSEEDVEKGRLDQDWKKFAELDSPTEKNSKPNTEKYSDINAENINTKEQYSPISGGEGTSVLRTQLMLDRTNFSPGIIDGKWGKNTEKAVYWLQKSNGIPAHGQVDKKTYEKIIELAGKPDKLIVEQKLTAKDVEGKFEKLPADIYEKAKLDCMCYESLEEKLSETYHITPGLLKQLNPKVEIKNLKAGDTIMIPNLEGTSDKSGASVARIIVSDGGHYVHGLDSSDKIVVHYPSTLGSQYNPSPSGEYKITGIAKDPSWNYQPKLLNKGDGENAIIPPGPNNAVGVMWMALSKPHFGIHGTSAPETIGYVTSSGCIRLTNWDALDLGGRVKAGTPVEFRDTANRSDDSENSGNSNTENKNSENKNTANKNTK